MLTTTGGPSWGLPLFIGALVLLGFCGLAVIADNARPAREPASVERAAPGPPRRPTWTPSRERHRGRPRPAGAGGARVGPDGELVLVGRGDRAARARRLGGADQELPAAGRAAVLARALPAAADRARRRVAGRDRDRLPRQSRPAGSGSRSRCSPPWACSRSSRTRNALSAPGSQSQAVKSLSYFLSFLLAYLLVCSTINSLPAAELVVRALVLGAAAIAIAAIYEARTNYDVFDHLHKWISFLEPTRAIKESARGAGRGCA